MIDLPLGFDARPLVPADAPAVVAVMAAQQQRDLGETIIELADIEADWQRPSFDLAAGSVGVLVDDVLVAYAETDGERGDACVHPAWEGRGLGTALAHWRTERARAVGVAWAGMPVPADSPGDRLLAALGHEVRWESWVLDLPSDTQIPPRDLPPGCALRPARVDEHEACWRLTEAAFGEWPDRTPESYDDWAARTVGRPGFEPQHLRVIVDREGDLLALALLVRVPDADGGWAEGYVDRLATRADRRGLGLAQALLADAFGLAREAGAHRCSLSTDSRTGALSLYERVGMVVTSTWRHRAARLAPPPSSSPS